MTKLIVGVADASFLGSDDFKHILERFDPDLQFAFYSPLAWFLGYRWRRANNFGFPLEFFSEYRFKHLERANVDLLKRNLIMGVEQGRLILIRDILLQRLYADLSKFVKVRSDQIGISTRDLCNILLANRLSVPLWMEKNADIWIEEAYKFRIGQRSKEISFPVRTNPKFDSKIFLSKIISLVRREVDFEDIVEEFISEAKRVLPQIIETKAIVLATLEPLPLWDHFDMRERIGVSIILTIIDIAGLTIRKR